MPEVASPVAYGPEQDRWLERWHARLMPLSGKSLLEIGCGAGHDSSYLCHLGFAVTGIDLDQKQILAARQRCPLVQFEACDLRDYLRGGAWQADVIVASLSLHYFDWAETLELFQIIRAKLPQHGLFLLRLNSTQDHHYGAHGHPPIEDHYHSVDGQAKRFFDRQDIERLMGAAWQLHHVEERVVHRYSSPKTLWEICATPLVA
jgi:cyclopropane fatty-acyl-phospholipid synthase-like methyltransferase